MALPYMTTVSVASTLPRALANIDTVKLELGITVATSDSLIKTAIDQQSVVAESYCKRVFAKETLIDSFRLTCRGWAPLSLSRWPVVSITSVVEDTTTLTAADYELDASAGMLWRLDGSDRRSSWSSAKIVVTFVAGYALPIGLPRDIERAVTLMVKQAWFSARRDPLVKQENVPGVYEATYWIGAVGDDAGLPPEAAALLDQYRMPNV